MKPHEDAEEMAAEICTYVLTLDKPSLMAIGAALQEYATCPDEMVAQGHATAVRVLSEAEPQSDSGESAAVLYEAAATALWALTFVARASEAYRIKKSRAN